MKQPTTTQVHTGLTMTLTQRYFLPLCFAALALAGCGGGAGTSSSSGGTVNAAQLEISSSATQIDSSGVTTATLTVVAKNSSNAVVPGVTVTFSATSGNLIVSNAVTDANGAAKAVIGVGANRANRTIEITATSSSASVKTEVDVRGTVLTVSGPNAVGLNTSVQLLATLKDSSGNPIANTPVSFRSSLNNGGNKICSTINCVTDSSGTLIITYSPTVGGNDSIVLSALNTSALQNINSAVTLITISIDSDGVGYPTNEFAVNQTGKLVHITLSGTTTFPATVALSSTAGTINPSSIQIPTAGATVDAMLSTNSSVGQGVIFAQHSVAGGVSNSMGFEIVSRTPSSITLQSSPSVIPANLAGSTSNKSTITASVRDVSGNPVKNATVIFSKPIDTSNGALQSATSQTNSAGLATTNYIAGPNPASGASGVLINANVNGVSSTAQTNVTVAGQALYVNLGFGNTITKESTTLYSKDVSVSVTDAAGNPVSGANIGMELQANAFFKGLMVLVKSDGTTPAPGETPARWGVNMDPLRPGVYTFCLNEDTNHTGTIQIGEDFNGNGRLDPGVRPSIVFVSGGTTPRTTDINGFATYKLMYLKEDALWSQYLLTASAATGNGGAQGLASKLYTLSISSDEVTDIAVNPPNRVSPFGYANTSCASPY